MYRLELAANGVTKHSRHCIAAFGRFDLNCHRCLELRAGAAPRPGWQRQYFTRKRSLSQGRLF